MTSGRQSRQSQVSHYHLPLSAEQDSPVLGNFNPSQLLPESLQRLDDHHPTDGAYAHPPPALPMSSPAASDDGAPSVFDEPHEHANNTDPTDLSRHASGDEPEYDLKPPPPSMPQSNVEWLSEKLFSSDHLRTILRNPTQSLRFTTFLKKYRPQQMPALVRYLETQKAIAAVEYANSVAEQLSSYTQQSHSHSTTSYTAAAFDGRFEITARRCAEDLIGEALPGYVTHRLVQIVTECLVKEIIGNNAPIMRELVQGLAEVYCLTDPSLPDNPIVYASEGEWSCERGVDVRDASVLTCLCRILPHDAVRQRVCHRPQLPLPPGSQIVQRIGLAAHRRACRGAGNLRDHLELVGAFHAALSPPPRPL